MTAIAHPSQSPHQMAISQSAPQTSKKSMNFFKRHLGHHKKRSNSVTFQNAPPQAPKPPPGTPVHTKPTPPESTQATPAQRMSTLPTEDTNGDTVPPQNGVKIRIRRPSSADGQRPTHARTFSNDSVESDRPNSSRGVKWAVGFEGEESSNRLRRLSSGATKARRSSIYARSTDGLYGEGVESGVGSKARRLSVQIPATLEVEVFPLTQYFSYFERKTKKQIGEGGAASVWIMYGKSSIATRKDKAFAVKEFRSWEPDQESSEEYRRKIKSEYAMAKSLCHPNIVATYYLCIDKTDEWFHVMQMCDAGDLNDAINDNFFTLEDRNCLFKQLLRGVQYLHARGIAHRDIKSENLLITMDSCLKIADFGTSEVFCGEHPGLRNCRRPSIIEEGSEIRLCTPGLIGSKPYMAPELLKHKENYDPRGIDIWSCAIVYVSLIAGGTPWEAADTKVKNYNVFCSTWDDYSRQFPDSCIQEDRPLPKYASKMPFPDPAARRLAMSMLHPDPKLRISANDALDSKVVTEMDCCQQDGYSDDIKTRQRKAMHNHVPPHKRKKLGMGR